MRAFKQITDRVLASIAPSLAAGMTPDGIAPDVLADFLIENIDVVRQHYQLPPDGVLRIVTPQYIAVSDAPGSMAMQPRSTVPSALKMAKNLLGAVVDTAKHAVQTGSVEVPDDVFEQRKSVCTACPKWEVKNGEDGNPDPDTGRCTACGCYTKFKLRLASQSCPEGRWSSWTPS